MNVLIIGAGFAGSVIARKLIDYNSEIKIKILEKRDHIGGNMYDEMNSHGVLVHKYGPHIFHTNSSEVFEFIGRFTEYSAYKHEVVGLIDGYHVPIPFNFTGIDKLFSISKAEELKTVLLENYDYNERVSINELLNSDNTKIKELGEFVYEKVFVHYTAKQWGIPIDRIDVSVINRIPVVMGYEEKHFTSRYQYMPQKGYTKMFENILNHPNIEVITHVNAKDKVHFDEVEKKIFYEGHEFNGPVIITGALDELINYRYGVLPYRTLNLVFEEYEMNYYQEKPVVNYPNSEKFTRITEFKHLTGQYIQNNTVILKEYPATYTPGEGKVPFYPIVNEESWLKYHEYKEYYMNFENAYLCGRLSEYKYYDMNSVILQAFKIADKIIKENF